MQETRRRKREAGPFSGGRMSEETISGTGEVSRENGTLKIRVGGDWTVDAGERFPEELLQQIGRFDGYRRVEFDASDLGHFDSRLVNFVQQVRKIAADRGAETDLRNLPDGVSKLLDLASAVAERKGARREETRLPLLERVGEKAVRAWEGFLVALDFIGESALSIVAMLRGRARFRKRDLMQFIQEAGVDALPIVGMISVLIGLILAFVGALQLKMFGAEIFVADLVGVGMAVEMGGLMTAIIMSGRTGAAYAAQLGTMQVNEEIDALQTMGFSPFEFLVLPRMIALIVMMPLLTLYSDLLGMIGGAVVGIFMLGITPEQYMLQTQAAVHLPHFAQGLVKASVFGVVIAVAGCFQGMRCGRSAQAVGEATTRAVVQCITLVVVADSILTVVYNVMLAK